MRLNGRQFRPPWLTSRGPETTVRRFRRVGLELTIRPWAVAKLARHRTLDPAAKVRLLPAQLDTHGGVERSVKDEIKLFTGNSNRPLAEAISADVGVPLGGAEIGRFSDGEMEAEITENVRGGDVFVIQSISSPTNDNLMEL